MKQNIHSVLGKVAKHKPAGILTAIVRALKARKPIREARRERRRAMRAKYGWRWRRELRRQQRAATQEAERCQ